MTDAADRLTLGHNIHVSGQRVAQDDVLCNPSDAKAGLPGRNASVVFSANMVVVLDLKEIFTRDF